MLHQPPAFRARSTADCLEIIAAHPFATLITVGPDGSPQLSHCPLVYGDDDGSALYFHLARANLHQQSLHDGQRVTAVFNGPQAYVSPTWYTEPHNVPTWNYIAVHVQGSVVRIDTAAQKDVLLKRLIQHLEPNYAAHWRGLPSDYQQRLLAAIVGFRLQIDQIDGKFKLSQNRQPIDALGVRNALAAGTQAQAAVADWMQKLGVGES